MTTRSPFVLVLVVLLSLALVIPPDVAAQAGQSAGQRAGQVSRVIPAVSIQRGAQKLTATAQAPVNWEDLVNTQRLARARIALDDGSILNVGSDSSLRITQHDAGAQQTQLDLTYGRVRSQAVRLAKPGAKFEVRTPAGVAGVVGTDFYVAYANGIMQLVVFEGLVQFCNLAGQCVNVGPGMTSTVRSNQQPDPPSAASPALAMEAGTSTEVTERPEVAPHRMNPWVIVGVAVLMAVPAIVIPLTNRGSRQTCTPNPQTGRLCP